MSPPAPGRPRGRGCPAPSRGRGARSARGRRGPGPCLIGAGVQARAHLEHGERGARLVAEGEGELGLLLAERAAAAGAAAPSPRAPPSRRGAGRRRRWPCAEARDQLLGQEVAPARVGDAERLLGARHVAHAGRPGQRQHVACVSPPSARLDRAAGQLAVLGQPASRGPDPAPTQDRSSAARAS